MYIGTYICICEYIYMYICMCTSLYTCIYAWSHVSKDHETLWDTVLLCRLLVREQPAHGESAKGRKQTTIPSCTAFTYTYIYVHVYWCIYRWLYFTHELIYYSRLKNLYKNMVKNRVVNRGRIWSRFGPLTLLELYLNFTSTLLDMDP